MKLIVEVEMEMPTNCSECQLKKDEQTCFNGRGVFGTEVQRMSWCPICGVLPEQHGDLIDADAIWERAGQKKGEADPLRLAAELCCSPVIIAAERKDDEKSC